MTTSPQWRNVANITPERIVAGVIAAMVVAVAAATAVGFWLSYGGLHDFAVTAGGLSGPEAWAWPASVDLFIVAGEAGVTISALRHRRDLMAWRYLLLGFAASVTGNVLHVHPGYLPWAKYAVAAVPPVAAMLALAALLRHVYRLALDAHLATAPATARAPRKRWWRRTRPAAAAVRNETVTVPASKTSARLPVRQRPGAKRDKAERLIAADPGVSSGRLAETLGVPRSTAARWKTAAMANGNGKAH